MYIFDSLGFIIVYIYLRIWIIVIIYMYSFGRKRERKGGNVIGDIDMLKKKKEWKGFSFVIKVGRKFLNEIFGKMGVSVVV